jgi:hypothetical protein
MSNQREHEGSFFRIAQFSSGLGVGAVAAFLFSIDHITPALEMSFDWGTVVAFFIGAAASWYFWSVVQDARQSGARPSLKRRLIVWGVLLLLATVVSFTLGMKHHSREKVIEFIIGTGTAIIFLAIGGALFYEIATFLNKEHRKHG